ncbi:MAG: phosphoserine phosphatase SerB [Gammaproteobacteria bacterium]|nr:phosphoserine phosphatase SerB [Gammaproteobacteria bacterium]
MQTTILHTPELSDGEKNLLNQTLSGELEPCEKHFRFHHQDAVKGEALSQLRSRFNFDINPVPEAFDPASLGLVITDMDSTLITIECIDEIADFAGRKAEVAAVTEAAMRGEIDFATSLTQRVAALEGLDESVLLRVYEERLALSPGAEPLLAGLKSLGVKIALVSGGFTFMTNRLETRLELDFTRANVLDIQGGKLTGKVVGDIVDAKAKADYLQELCDELKISTHQAIAMGDGANDLKMMALAGCGVAYRAKPKVQAETDVVINHGTLANVLHLLHCTG